MMESKLDGTTEALDRAYRKKYKERRDKMMKDKKTTPKKEPHGAQLKGSTRTCSKCGEVGHFKKTCGRKKKERKKRKPQRVPEGGGGESD